MLGIPPRLSTACRTGVGTPAYNPLKTTEATARNRRRIYNIYIYIYIYIFICIYISLRKLFL